MKQPYPSPPFTLYGFKIIVAKKWPKMKLSDKVTVTPEFRREMDTWMAEFFGYWCPIERGTVLKLETENVIIVHPDDYHELRAKHMQQFPSEEKESLWKSPPPNNFQAMKSIQGILKSFSTVLNLSGMS